MIIITSAIFNALEEDNGSTAITTARIKRDLDIAILPFLLLPRGWLTLASRRRASE